MQFLFFFSSILSILLIFPETVLSVQTVLVDELPNYRTIGLSSVIGPESIAFDPAGGGPYTGVSDGRILKWEGHLHGWVEFAVPPRPRGVSKQMCDGSSNITMEDKCGRPLGLQFHKATGGLYIADAYFGLLVVCRRGGIATRLAASAEGVPFALTNGVDIDQQTGMVYFTDSSSQYQRRGWVWSVITNDNTGRFMSYNPRTKQVKVLLRGLEFPNGVAVSKDNTFILVGESTKQQVLKYWLKGPKAGAFEIFATVTGYPDNIKRNPTGEFWVAINTGKAKIQSLKSMSKEERDEIAGDPLKVQSQVLQNTVAMRFNAGGEVLEELGDSRTTNSVSEVEENNGTLWLGSAVSPFVGVYKPFI